jgi:uncharacterized membrane protein YphA (DoxX/SURF4 family)
VTVLLATASVFTTLHIAVTAVIAGALAFLAALLLAGPRTPALLESVLVGALTVAAVFLWRRSANMPALNNDGLQGFSANDWLAPTIVFVFLSLYGKLKPPIDARRFGRALAVATLIAFAVNVITI